jgi:hypothetical protein
VTGASSLEPLAASVARYAVRQGDHDAARELLALVHQEHAIETAARHQARVLSWLTRYLRAEAERQSAPGEPPLALGDLLVLSARLVALVESLPAGRLEAPQLDA